MKRAINVALFLMVTLWPLHLAASEQSELRIALDAVAKYDWNTAKIAVRDQDQITQDIVEWHALRAGHGTFRAYQKFLARRPDWPGLKLMRRVGEARIGANADPAETISYFAPQLPQTGAGSLALASALTRLGAAPVGADEIRRAWLTMPLSKDLAAQVLREHGPLVAELHEARLDFLLWSRHYERAEEMLELVSEDFNALAHARLALLQGRRGVDELIEEIPTRLRNDAGLAYARFVWRIAAGRTQAAEDLLLEHSARPNGLGKPQKWARARAQLARGALADNRAGRAYLITSSHGLQSGGDYAALEWLAGFIALTELDEPAAAVAHFQRFRVAVDTPISLGRAGYWEGRALEALGRTDEAQLAYEFGAEFYTSFYGQLAAIKAGVEMPEQLAGTKIYPSLEDTPLRNSSVLIAARQFAQAGSPLMMRRFLRHLAESANLAEQGALVDLAMSYENAYAAIYIAKYSAQSGDMLVRGYFPTQDILPEELPVEDALALAIARRESEFNTAAQSQVGARGLMQLMPATGQHVARRLDLDIKTDDLVTDPQLNVLLGANYLAELSEQFEGYLPFIAAGYNAGPGRVVDWRRALGDPRGDIEDAVIWIESIPFAETRNYVMRVLEALQVYRAQNAGKPISWSIGDMLIGD